MNINRQNYEECFLLYVDGELRPDERLAVENFVAQNPDLSAELELLKQVILQHQDIIFQEKEQLFKNEAGISLSNYQTYFLLYTDNELSDSDINEVERFVLQHPELQDEFTLIQKTKLIPERLVFKDKKSLYRTEKERRIIPIFWMRMSVAAAIIAAMVLSWGLFQNNTTATEPIQVAGTNKPVEKTIDRSSTNNVANVNTQPQAIDIIQPKSLDEGVQKQTSLTSNKVNNPRKTNTTKENNQVKQILPSPTTITQEEQQQSLVKGETQNNVNNNKEEVAFQSNNEKKNELSNETINQRDIISLASNQTIDGQPLLVSNTLYREVDTNDEERNLYIGSATINKNKIRGLFKKAARLFGKNTNETERF